MVYWGKKRRTRLSEDMILIEVLQDVAKPSGGTCTDTIMLVMLALYNKSYLFNPSSLSRPFHPLRHLALSTFPHIYRRSDHCCISHLV